MMYGDFSRWSFDPRTNYAGILHQQGRVLLDADTNDQTLLGLRWQDTAARDAFGALILAVPASDRDAFKVSDVTPSGTDLEVTLLPGRAWADGRLVHAHGDPPDLAAAIKRTATPIPPPTGSSLAGDELVILLEVWRDAVSGFCSPKELIEPALGGPDTTERVATLFRLRSALAAPGETCDEVARRVQDDLRAADRGRLHATLDPTTTTTGDCPVVEHGGYSGLEHNLYLIEIAEVDPAASPTGAAFFKWSPLGGGLVGRGVIDAAGDFELRGGREAILRAGLTEVYVEIIEPRPLRPGPSVSDRDAALAETWEVVYGAKATITSDGRLVFSQDYYGAPPVAGAPRACRIWHELRGVDEFPAGLATPNTLRDGIRLEFDAGKSYVVGDRWTFSVRAGGLANPPVLLDHAPPSEIVRVRVPLARVRWEGERPVIDDCRQVFQPLTRQQTCCRIRVGDGVHSHGDFTTIKAALAHLPREGGEICVLPGIYQESVSIDGFSHLVIRGCGEHTRLAGDPRAPIFTIREGLSVTIRDLNLRAADNQRGIVARKSARVRILGNLIGGNGAPAIDVEGSELEIQGNRINVRDAATTDPAVVVEALGAQIRDNAILVATKLSQESERSTAPAAILRPTLQATALGGLWLRGGCQDVEVVGNTISGGRGHGILLGHLEQITIQGVIVLTRLPVEPLPSDDNPCPPGELWVPPASVDQDTYTIAGPPLARIRILDNKITGMGFSGISVIGFLPTIQQGLISVNGLEIRGNTIQRCLQRPLANTRKEMMAKMGYGGIILADAEDLRIRDNRILDNGVRHIEAICGIYVLHVEGAEIARNQIINNGPRTADAGAVQPGARGGIFVALATSPVIDIDVTPGSAPATWISLNPERRGLPAIRVCENTVAHPVGRALTINSLGPALVTDNNLTTLGVAPGNGILFAAVQILALGLSPELLSARASFTDLRKGQVVSRVAAAPQAPLVLLSDAAPPVSEATPVNVNAATPAAAAANLPTVSLAMAKPSPLLLVIPTGDVLFADNQVLLDLRDAAQELALAAIGIFSLDDVSVEGNQSSCCLYGDVVWVHAMAVGMSVRFCQNRLKEPLPSAFLSGITYGLANTTTLNQSTHCLLIRGPQKIDVGNIEAVEALSPGTCKPLDPVLSLLQ
ncbi:MAG: right-handed parallel beta-helix repeat-containing protein [Myxococcales bacterium]|nr:right-handed parallel beta-helix repeat-containing protein [Myxococcales bacterium]